MEIPECSGWTLWVDVMIAKNDTNGGGEEDSEPSAKSHQRMRWNDQ